MANFEQMFAAFSSGGGLLIYFGPSGCLQTHTVSVFLFHIRHIRSAPRGEPCVLCPVFSGAALGHQPARSMPGQEKSDDKNQEQITKAEMSPQRKNRHGGMKICC